MSKLWSWLWNDDSERERPASSDSSEWIDQTEGYLSPKTATSLNRAKKLVSEIEGLVLHELDLIAEETNSSEEENFEPGSASSSASNSPNPHQPRRGSRRSSLSQLRNGRGPRLIRPLNKKKHKITVGDMVYDPIAGVWKGNESDLEVFSKSPKLITPSEAPKSTVGNMKWDPVSKTWRGNEEELNKFAFNPIGLITSFSGNLISGLANQSGMKWNDKVLRWESTDYEDPFEAEEGDTARDAWDVGDDFTVTDELKELWTSCAVSHRKTLANWFKDSSSKYRTLKADSLRQLVLARIRAMEEDLANIDDSESDVEFEEEVEEKKDVVDVTDDWGDVDFSGPLVLGGAGKPSFPGLRGSDTDDSDIEKAFAETPVGNRQRPLEAFIEESDDDGFGFSDNDEPSSPEPVVRSLAGGLKANLQSFLDEESIGGSSDESESGTAAPIVAPAPDISVSDVSSDESDLEVPEVFLPQIQQLKPWVGEDEIWEELEDLDDDEEYHSPFLPLDREKDIFSEDWSDVEVPQDLPERRPNAKKTKVTIKLKSLPEEDDLDGLDVEGPLVLAAPKTQEVTDTEEDDWGDIAFDAAKLSPNPITGAAPKPATKPGPQLITLNSLAKETNLLAEPKKADKEPVYDEVAKRWVFPNEEDPFGDMSGSDDLFDSSDGSPAKPLRQQDDDPFGDISDLSDEEATGPKPKPAGLNMIHMGDDEAKPLPKPAGLKLIQMGGADLGDAYPFSDISDLSDGDGEAEPSLGAADDDPFADISDLSDSTSPRAPTQIPEQPTTAPDENDPFLDISDLEDDDAPSLEAPPALPVIAPGAAATEPYLDQATGKWVFPAGQEDDPFGSMSDDSW